LLADAIPESAKKDSENDIEGPNLDSENVLDSDAIHELLKNIDIDSDEGQVDTWSDGILGGLPKTTTMAPEANDHKESLHFFPNIQQVNGFLISLIKNRNMLPEGSLTTFASFPSPIILSNDFSSTLTSSHVAQNNRQRKLQAQRKEFSFVRGERKRGGERREGIRSYSKELRQSSLRCRQGSM
jgi:hypothetical protein